MFSLRFFPSKYQEVASSMLPPKVGSGAPLDWLMAFGSLLRSSSRILWAVVNICLGGEERVSCNWRRKSH